MTAPKNLIMGKVPRILEVHKRAMLNFMKTNRALDVGYIKNSSCNSKEKLVSEFMKGLMSGEHLLACGT